MDTLPIPNDDDDVVVVDTHIVLAPKVKLRKPYTISKQRQTWSDEEHSKFLQSLKLYGRGWRQIQEFIGTKTAVQIRSHAQKFFSKVARGGNDRSESPVEAIEIPPPRPKRKPTHPYPRKLVESQSSSNESLAFPPQKRICPLTVTTNYEDQSTMPHMLESPISDSPVSCLSTWSGSADLQSGSLFSVNNEEILKPFSSIKYNGKAVTHAANRCANSTVDISTCEEEADVPEDTIILFGQIVSTKDSQRTSRDSKNTLTPSKQQLAASVDDNINGKLDESPLPNGLNKQWSQGLFYGNWRQWSCHEINSDSMEEIIHGRRLYSSMMKTDSTKDTPSAVKFPHSPVLGVDITSPKRNYRSGFVPYQRCFAEGNIKSANTLAEEAAGQLVRLCL